MRDNTFDCQIGNGDTIAHGTTIGYCAGSDTIRQFPQNYLIASRSGACGVWVVDADGAVDVKTALMVQMALMCDQTKFLRKGQEVVDRIAENYLLYKIEVSEA